VAQIGALCERFENELRADQAPQIEEYLARVPQSQQPDLLKRLLALELDHRRQHGELPSEAEYRARFSGYADSIQPVFSESTSQDAVSRTTDWTGPTGDSAPNELLLEELPRTVAGRYELREVLGKGGFGTVYLGHDGDLDRPVAIKFLDSNRLSFDRAFETLQSEARTLAKLRHPGIVAVHDVGRDEHGTCYMVMDYIEGRSLKDWMSTEQLSARQAAAGLAAVAEAVHHAHTQALVHCDLKPGNILVDAKDRFYVADFGLAVHEDTQRLLAGEVGGTRIYMAPEQVRGETHRLDGRTDIWGLGVVLYELLAMRRPFRGRSQDELFDEIKNREPKPLRQIDDSISSELERICLKCLSKRMTDRYTTAMDLANDLHQWVQTQSDGSAGSPLPGDYSAGDPSSSSQRSWSTYPRRTPVKIVPRGLRPFGSQDRNFFLDLLPGPRNRDGLPESVQFWKTRIEEVDAGFNCGLIYGPSGCGKSSFVRAGLLPRLAGHVGVVYIEAVPDATELRLLKELRKRCPQLSDDWNLAESFAILRAGKDAWPDRKILVVIDQFEQWLHAHEGQEDGMLVDALRQCDGQRLQCLLLVRDDFWLATTRFLQALEVRLVEGENVGLVDLFGRRHAAGVLTDFGRALGCLPEDLSQLTEGQEAFIDRSVDALAIDEKVVPLRLSLFAEMVKTKRWLPETLDEVGGMEGLGVVFLEESFGARTANPQHRLHQPSARAVLKALLPDHWADIRGRVRAHNELLDISGYADRPADFNDLLRILNSELRLITPTDPEGQQETNSDRAALQSDQRYYQLSHDYLVSSLREWLTQKQKESWRGRARLCLEERTAQWKRTQASRFLPSPLEYLTICAAVPKKQQEPDQRRVLRAAGRRYGTSTLLLLALTAVLGWGAWNTHGRIQGDCCIQEILTAKLTDLKRRIDEAEPYHRWTEDGLKNVFSSPATGPQQRLRAGLALFPPVEKAAYSANERLLVEYVRDRLFDCRPDEFSFICEGLAPYKQELLPDLWMTFHDAKEDSEVRFRAGVALAKYEPPAATIHDDSKWLDADAAFLAEHLVGANPDYQRDWRVNLEPIAGVLPGSLEALFRDELRSVLVRTAAARALADFAAEDAELLAELAADAIAPQYAELFRVLAAEPLRSMAAERSLEIVAQTSRTDASDADRLQLARRRCGAAITLIRLDMHRDALGVFRTPEDGDAEAATQFVHRLKDRGVTAADILQCLDNAREPTARFPLLLALGEFVVENGFAVEDEFAIEGLSPAQCASLQKMLLDWYRHDGDSGIHAACDWLLRHGGGAALLAEVGKTPVEFDPSLRRTWFTQQIAGELMTFVVFRPGTVIMGSPESDPNHADDEQEHEEEIERHFAICDREVTQRLYDLFQDTMGSRLRNEKYVLSPDHAVLGVSWFNTVHFCRWLTEQAGMGEDDQCYHQRTLWKQGIGGVMSNVVGDIEHSGFRLPTEAEWEYACRSGTQTPFSFGDDVELLDNYGWFFDNARRHGHVPGRLRPNLRGLFDMHGNACEWCNDRYRSYIGEPSACRVLRSGGWSYRADQTRSAYRQRGEPMVGLSNYGFRVVRTITDADAVP